MTVNSELIYETRVKECIHLFISSNSLIVNMKVYSTIHSIKTTNEQTERFDSTALMLLSLLAVNHLGLKSKNFLTVECFS